MLKVIIIGCAVVIVLILFYPRRSPHERRVTKSYGGQHYGKARE